MRQSRQSQLKDRRAVAPDTVSPADLRALSKKVTYVGHGNHKRFPANYGLTSTSPRPTKSLCDMTRTILLEEALALLKCGVLKGIISQPRADGFPKYIWSVSAAGEVFEAKSHPNDNGRYHGYPLENEDAMRAHILSIWK
ncbi:hypothetical protein [Verminephrobacter eiseniae]|nr:hypothetical protein [Verminephrobacter eiseniae]MCW5286740.1 hypothetical protein [Verminephrobacter eiseniae]MCW5305037.1 hypothetical protein [Verminephrobacter eiseniae]MCW8180975.1 hypothetical protein [Verminephrobacter eiseniae]MCW8190145.1 hypothetical protein [Verminephrobacter eiseniae]